MTVEETKSPEITRAAQRYLEQYGDPLVMDTYLKITILVIGAICLMLGALTFKSQKALASMRPLVIRINDVGHADAIDYRNYEYKPQEAENKYYLSRWATLFFQRNRYTIERDQTQSLYFLNSDVQQAVIRQEQLSKTIATFQQDSTLPYVDINIKSVILDDLRVSPYSARVEFEKVYTNANDHTQLKNPDIFGSMIQAVAEDEERGALGMHYTSVPNILKVLNPLFLEELLARLEEAGDNPRTLLNLRKRMAKIRVFDPACGSGNFLVIAYKAMREMEVEINQRRGEPEIRSEIPLTNFRGIELRDFPAEIARLALVIAEYQCDVLYRGQKLALAEFLPLRSENWITCGNALRLDWLSICPPTGTGVKMQADDLFSTPLDQAEIDFANEGGETYICGNPPYLGSKWQSDEQKDELKDIFQRRTKSWKSLDYVAGWFMKAADYGIHTDTVAAFVSTNSICQGQQVPILWPLIFETEHEIAFAHTSFKWTNLASHNAGVIVAIIGIARAYKGARRLFSLNDNAALIDRTVPYINAYLVSGPNSLVEQTRNPLSSTSQMLFGNMPRDGGNFILSGSERGKLLGQYPELGRFIRPYLGSEEMIQGKLRWCIWLQDQDFAFASEHPYLREVLRRVKQFRLESDASSTRDFAARPYRFVQIAGTAKDHSLVVAKVSSERRPCIPITLLAGDAIASDLLFALYDAPLLNVALIASRLHLVWIATVCGKLKTDFRYSNTLGWNTFPVPYLTEKNTDDLTDCAEGILLAREQHFPASIADLYDPDAMPDDLRAAHERNDEVLERIYIGRRFKNDTERLEKLFALYDKQRAAK